MGKLMNWKVWIGSVVVTAGIGCALVRAQSPPATVPEVARRPAPGPIVLDWTPPALAQLSTQAAVKSSFTLDRTMLGLAAGMVPDSEPETRRAIDRIDGVSVHVLRFGDTGIPDEAPVDAIRAAYHLRGWKHLVTTTAANSKSPLQNGTTDVWMVLDGVNVRGA